MPTRMGTGRGLHIDGVQAAKTAVTRAMDVMGDGEITLAIVFISPQHEPAPVLAVIREFIGDAPLVGCSSSAEFTEESSGRGSVAVTTITSDRLEVSVGVGNRFVEDTPRAVSEALASFSSAGRTPLRPGWQGRTMFLLVDGLVGGAEEVIDELMMQTSMQYQLFGGAAADEAKFRQTRVFYNDQVLTDAFVCVEMLSEHPYQISFTHGWQPASRVYRVTHAQGNVLHEINGQTAWQIYQDYAVENGISIVSGQESQYLMDHIIGIQIEGGHKLRVPLFAHPDGSITCAAEVPEGALVQFMRSDDDSILEGGQSAVQKARADMGRAEIAGAIAFECVATQLKMGDRFSDQIQATAGALQPGTLLGCASFGQLARIRGGFSGLMDATSLVCLIAA